MKPKIFPTIQFVNLWETKLLPIDIFCFAHQQNTHTHPALIIFNSTTASQARFHFRFQRSYRDKLFLASNILAKFNNIEISWTWSTISSILLSYPSSTMHLCTYSNLSLSFSVSLPSLGSIERFQRTKLGNSLLDRRLRAFLGRRRRRRRRRRVVSERFDARCSVTWRVTRHTTHITRIPPSISLTRFISNRINDLSRDRDPLNTLSLLKTPSTAVKWRHIGSKSILVDPRSVKR